MNNFLVLNTYQKKYLHELKKLIPGEPFPPWTNRVVLNNEGIFGAGWTINNHILMICYDGYFLANPASGEIIEENLGISPYDHMTRDNLAFNIPNTGEIVKIFGLFGGDGNYISSDGWKLQILHLVWPNSVASIKKPTIIKENKKMWQDIQLISLVSLEYGNLKCGFSLNEKHFMILGINHGIEIFTRL